MIAQRATATTAAALIACTLLLQDFADAAAATRRGATTIFDANFDQFPAHTEPDISQFKDTTSVGCTGFLRDGKACGDGDVNAVFAPSPSGSGTCMQVKYPAGKYASRSGVQFYTDVNVGDEATLEYDVYFPGGFDFVNGGKLPGMHGGNMQCTGSKETPNGHNCWSSRLMWEAEGAVEGYLYIPIHLQSDSFCKMCRAVEGGGNADSCGQLSGQDYCNFMRGAATLQRGEWNSVKQYVKMNSPGAHDGVFEMWINGNLVASADNVFYRDTTDICIRGLLFSTFFGGDSSKFAPSDDQVGYFQNVRMYA